jgi:hypothetical protein
VEVVIAKSFLKTVYCPKHQMRSDGEGESEGEGEGEGEGELYSYT